MKVFCFWLAFVFERPNAAHVTLDALGGPALDAANTTYIGLYGLSLQVGSMYAAYATAVEIGRGGTACQGYIAYTTAVYIDSLDLSELYQHWDCMMDTPGAPVHNSLGHF